MYSNVAMKKPVMCGFYNKNQSRIQAFCHFNFLRAQASLSHPSNCGVKSAAVINRCCRAADAFERYWPEWRDGRNVNCNR